MLHSLLWFLRVHIDAVIGALATCVPIWGGGVVMLFRVVSGRYKRQQEVRLLVERRVAQSRAFAEMVFQYEKRLLTDARITHLHMLEIAHPLNLLDVYVPLYLHPHSVLSFTPASLMEYEAIEPDALLLAAQETLAHRVSESLSVEEVLRSYRRSVVVGDPGIGKTTLLQYLVVKAVRRELVEFECTPIYIQLNTFDVAKHADLTDMMLAQMGCTNNLVEMREYLHASMREGRILLLLDGLDETMIDQNRDGVENKYSLLVKAITQLAVNYPLMPMVVTVRKAGYQRRPKMRGFHELEIMGFRPEDSQQYIHNWFAAYPTVKRLEKERHLNACLKRSLRLQSLSVNPLLLSLIMIVYEGDMQLPEHRADLYKKCIEVLQCQWDRSHDIQRKRDFPLACQTQVLQQVAWYFHQAKKRFIPLEELLTVIEGCLPCAGIPKERSHQILEYITLDSGLLREHTQNWYGFAQLTFQEYFVTQYIITMQQEAFLLQHLHDPWWEEVLLLYVGCVNDASTLLGALLNQDIQSPLHDDLFLTPLILTGRCLSEKPWAVERVFFMQVVERLFQALHCTPYTLARERIARTLVDMNNPQVRARLLWCLADAHVSLSVRESIGRAFGYASGQTLAPFLMELLRQPQTGRSIRIVIAHALGVLGESSVVHDLLILLRDSREDIYVRQSIASTLGLLGECLPELLQICQNKDEQALVLQRVVQACEKLRDPRATDVLCQLLRNSSLDWYVRGSSARALGKLAAKGAISTMLVLLQDRDENVYVRRCVALAFGSFARADVPISHLLAILYNQDVDVSVRASLAQSFALMGDSSLVPYLLKLFALPSCPVRVRIQLALALGMLESPNKREVLHTLRTVAEQPDSGRDLYVSVIIAQGLAGESYVVDELLSLFIDEHLSQDMLSHVTRVLISVSNHETIDRHNIARKLVQLLLRSAQERYRGQCIVAALGELHDTEIVPDLCHLLTMTTIDRSIRCEIAACIAQLAQDEATEAKLYRLLAITDIRDDIYRTLWIVSRHVKRV